MSKIEVNGKDIRIEETADGLKAELPCNGDLRCIAFRDDFEFRNYKLPRNHIELRYFSKKKESAKFLYIKKGNKWISEDIRLRDNEILPGTLKHTVFEILLKYVP